MSLLKDCSEIREAARLARELAAEMGAESATPAPRTAGARSAGGDDSSVLHGLAPAAAWTSAPPAAPPSSFAPALRSESSYRGDVLASIVAAMCRRGGFAGAVLADASGLPLVSHNSPVDDDRVAAFTAVLGDALEQAGRFLSQPGADYISLDINYADKAVLRRFALGELRFFLMVLCPQGVDTRGEMELCVKSLVSALA